MENPLNVLGWEFRGFWGILQRSQAVFLCPTGIFVFTRCGLAADLSFIINFYGLTLFAAGVLLFALIGFAILYAFYMQVARICLYAFADELRTFEGGIPAASDNRFAGRAADMGVAVDCFCLIAVVAC